MNNTIQLLLCVLAIYTSFISWSYFQEKLVSTDYGTNAFFHAPLVINITQSLLCIVTGTIYLYTKTKNDLNIPFIPKFTKRSILLLYAISISQSISAPLSYQSLDHVDYVLYLLAKSCKLIPVMFVHYILFGTRYPLQKYAVAIIITLGVGIFTIDGMKSGVKSPGEDGNIVLGIAMLCGSLLLDGFMNSAQDVLFKSTASMTGAHLMVLLNLFTMINLTVYSILFTNQIRNIFEFVVVNGSECLYDLFKFSLCGALGQIFIFITLEKFSSVVLVTVTVTRKMLSMAVSVLLFGHVLTIKQWFGLILVFLGVIMESVIKIFSKKRNVEVKVKGKVKEKKI